MPAVGLAAKVKEIDASSVKLSFQEVHSHPIKFLSRIPKKNRECFEQFLALFQNRLGC